MVALSSLFKSSPKDDRLPIPAGAGDTHPSRPAVTAVSPTPAQPRSSPDPDAQQLKQVSDQYGLRLVHAPNVVANPLYADPDGKGDVLTNAPAPTKPTSQIATALASPSGDGGGAWARMLQRVQTNAQQVSRDPWASGLMQAGSAAIGHDLSASAQDVGDASEILAKKARQDDPVMQLQLKVLERKNVDALAGLKDKRGKARLAASAHAVVGQQNLAEHRKAMGLTTTPEYTQEQTQGSDQNLPIDLGDSSMPTDRQLAGERRFQTADAVWRGGAWASGDKDYQRQLVSEGKLNQGLGLAGLRLGRRVAASAADATGAGGLGGVVNRGVDTAGLAAQAGAAAVQESVFDEHKAVANKQEEDKFPERARTIGKVPIDFQSGAYRTEQPRDWKKYAGRGLRTWFGYAMGQSAEGLADHYGDSDALSSAVSYAGEKGADSTLKGIFKSGAPRGNPSEVANPLLSSPLYYADRRRDPLYKGAESSNPALDVADMDQEFDAGGAASSPAGPARFEQENPLFTH